MSPIIYVFQFQHIENVFKFMYYVHVSKHDSITVARNECFDICPFPSEWYHLSHCCLLERLYYKTPFDVHATIKRYMGIYGIDHVRGGMFDTLVLEDITKREIERELNYVNDMAKIWKQEIHHSPKHKNKLLDEFYGNMNEDDHTLFYWMEQWQNIFIHFQKKEKVATKQNLMDVYNLLVSVSPRITHVVEIYKKYSNIELKEPDFFLCCLSDQENMMGIHLLLQKIKNQLCVLEWNDDKMSLCFGANNDNEKFSSLDEFYICQFYEMIFYWVWNRIQEMEFETFRMDE